MENTFEQATIKKIFEILEQYADQKWDEVDWLKVSTTIYELVLFNVVSKLLKQDLAIADNMRDIWRHLQSGAER